jgi:hypothetical protein
MVVKDAMCKQVITSLYGSEVERTTKGCGEGDLFNRWLVANWKRACCVLCGFREGVEVGDPGKN